MRINATLLALSGLLAVGLVGGAGLAGAGEAPPAAAVGAPAEQVGGEGIVFTTTSSRSDLRLPGTPTTSTGYVLLDRPCDALTTTDAVPATTDVEVSRSYRSRLLWVTEQPVGAWCAMVVGLGVAQTEPASGVLLVRSAIAEPAAPPIAISYTVRRFTPLSAFLQIGGWAAACGAVCALTLLVLLRRRVDGLPADYDYGKPWSSVTAAVTAVGASLLAGGGLLAALAPQYQAGGIVVANVVVTAMLAAAPAVVAAFYARSGPKGKRRTLAVAGGITVTAIVAQVELDGLYVFQTDLSPATRAWLSALGGAALLFLVFYVVIGLATLREPASSS